MNHVSREKNLPLLRKGPSYGGRRLTLRHNYFSNFFSLFHFQNFLLLHHTSFFYLKDEVSEVSPPLNTLEVLLEASLEIIKYEK